MKIIYHGGSCADGFCAAWLLHKVYPDAEFLPMQYGDVIFFDPLVDEDIIIADFSFDRETMIQIAEIAKSVKCYDHHQTAEAELKGLDFCEFDMKRSGAKMVYDAYRNQIIEAMTPKYYDEATHLPYIQSELFQIGRLVGYVQDRDLWRWELLDSRAVSAAIQSYPMTFETWDRFDVDELCVEGKAILRYQNQIVDRLCKKAWRMEIGGYDVPVVNSPVLQSEIGEKLAQGEPFAAIYFDLNDAERVYSLRSAPDGVDVSEVAKALGGGGHPRSAGFKSWNNS